MKGKYKRVQSWCPKCDRVMVEGGKKCESCGSRFEVPKLNPKVMTQEELDEIRIKAYRQTL